MSETVDAAPQGGDESGYTPAELAGAPEEGQAQEPNGSSQPEAAPGQSDQPQGEAQPPKQGFVPHGALHEERTRRREAEQRFQMLEERQNRLIEHLTRQQQGQGQPQAEPDINTDPVAYFKAQNERLEQELAQIRQPLQVQAQNAQFVQSYRQQAQPFISETPDFQAAYEHAVRHMAADAPFAGMSSAQEMEQFMAQMAMRNGRNPAQVIYEYAKARGYGAQPPAKTPPDMGALQRGREASRSVGAGGQPAGRGELTPERLASMSAKELAAVPDEVFARVMGG